MKDVRHGFGHGGRWMRHMAAVPKGFFRWQVLELLNEKPRSGSEIMEEMEKRTNGCWRPGPGSVYPLLSWLHESGHIKVESEQEGIKRYTLTPKGRELLSEMRKLKENFERRRKFFATPFFGGMWAEIPEEQARDLRCAVDRLFSAFIRLRMRMGEKYSEKTVKELTEIINEAAEKMERLGERPKGGETDG
jgi:DNA-binding PadR family transcriptional regulator